MIRMKFVYLALSCMFVCLSASAQTDRKDVRAGNRKFSKENFKEAEIDYRKAVLKDSLSVAGEYNLANTLYREQDYEGASQALSTVKDVAPQSENAAQYYFNAGDVALQRKDYQSAVDAFKSSLLLAPDDLDAKENYIYAKLMLQNQQNQDNNQNQDQNQDQNQNNDQNQNDDQNQDNDQDQNQDNNQNQDQNQENQQQQPQQDPKISPQQAQQMLNAIQAKEKDTQDKVNKEKAALLQSKQKEKNW